MKKKVLSVALSLSLVMGSFGMAFANNASQADLKVLQDKKVLTGDASGDLMLEKELKRQDSVILLSRLMGKEDVAKTYPVDIKFVDVADDFYKPYITWANKNGFFNGMSETMFGFGQVMTVQQFQAVMLRALGYGDTAWNEVPAKAKELGFGAENVSENLTRGHMAGILSQGLRAETKDGQVLAKKLEIEMPVLIKEVAKLEDVKVDINGTPELPKTVKATMEDGTEKDVEVKWASVDTSKAAELTVDGTIEGFEAGVNVKVIVEAAKLDVVSVKALNLVQVEVKFNKTVDEKKAKETKHYSFGDDFVVKSAKVQEDKKTVILTLDGYKRNDDNEAEEDKKIFSQQEEYTLKVADTLVEKEVKFTPFDASIPEAKSIKLTGPNRFEIEFSEPLKYSDTKTGSKAAAGYTPGFDQKDNYLEGNIEINDGVYGIDLEETKIVGNTLKVKLSADQLEDGKYKVEIQNIEDFAGFKSVKKTFELDYKKDTTVPTVKVSDFDQKSVTVEFDKPVKLENTDDSDGNKNILKYFYHSFSSYKPVKVEALEAEKDSGDEFVSRKFKVIFFEADNDKSKALPQGNVKFVMDYDANQTIQDEWGNKLTSNFETVLKVEADTTKPEVKEIKPKTQKEIRVYFTEDVNEKNAQNEENFVIKNAKGEEITVGELKYVKNSDDKVYYTKLIFSDELKGAYTVEIKDIADTALEANTIVKKTYDFNVTDTTALKVADVTAVQIGSDNTLIVSFPEDMTTTGAGSILDKKNFLILKSDGSVAYTLDDNDKIALFKEKKKIKITIKDDDLDIAGKQLQFGRLKDAVGNDMDQISHTVSIGLDTAPEIKKIRTKDKKTVEIVFDKHLSSISAGAIKVARGIDKDGNTVSGAVYETLASVSYENKKEDIDGDGTKEDVAVVKATLRSGQQLHNSGDKTSVKFQVADGSKIKSETGTKSAQSGVLDITIEDKFVPEMLTSATKDANVVVLGDKVKDSDGNYKKDAEDNFVLENKTVYKNATNDNQIVLVMSEDMASDITNAAADFEIKYDGDTLIAFTDYTVKSEGNKVIIDLVGIKDEDLKDNKNIYIKTKEKINYLKDDDGNKSEKIDITIQVQKPKDSQEYTTKKVGDTTYTTTTK